MTSSPTFSVNFTTGKNPAYLNYHMSIKKSQAILKILLYRSRVQRLVYAGLTENKTMFGDTQHLFQLDCRSRFSKHYTKLLIWERKHGGGAQRNITIDTYLISRIRCAALLQITFTLLIFKKTVQIITLYLDWSSIRLL